MKAGVRINITVRIKACFVESRNKTVSEDTGNRGERTPSVGPEESRAESRFAWSVSLPFGWVFSQGTLKTDSLFYASFACLRTFLLPVLRLEKISMLIFHELIFSSVLIF